MKIVRLFLLVVVPFLFMRMSSCDKPVFDGENCTGDCFILKGKVTDSASSLGLPGVQLKLYYRQSGYVLLGGTQLLVNSHTDQNGNYSMVFDATRYDLQRGYLIMDATHPSYFLTPYGNAVSHDLAFTSADINRQKQLDFSMFYPGTVKLKVKTDSSDFNYLNVTYEYGKGGYGFYLDGKRKIDTTILIKTATGIQTRINWSTVSDGKIKTQKKDSILVARDSIPEYNIRF